MCIIAEHADGRHFSASCDCPFSLRRFGIVVFGGSRSPSATLTNAAGQPLQTPTSLDMTHRTCCVEFMQSRLSNSLWIAVPNMDSPLLTTTNVVPTITQEWFFLERLLSIDEPIDKVTTEFARAEQVVSVLN
jgi:hypothetical protein